MANEKPTYNDMETLVQNATSMNEEEIATGKPATALYVYEWPVRLWHWLNAFAIVALCITGYFIGSPMQSLSGEASDHFLMGYIRFIHFAAGYVMFIGFLVRIYTAYAGNHHARELFSVPILTKAFWGEVLYMLKWYAFIVPRPHRYVGHNPLSRVAMLAFVIMAVFMMVTGMALYGEGAQGWSNVMFTSWVLPLFGNSQNLHTWHHLVMWGIICFVILHVYAAIREDIMGRQSMVSTMLSGYRYFKQD